MRERVGGGLTRGLGRGEQVWVGGGGGEARQGGLAPEALQPPVEQPAEDEGAQGDAQRDLPRGRGVEAGVCGGAGGCAVGAGGVRWGRACGGGSPWARASAGGTGGAGARAEWRRGLQAGSQPEWPAAALTRKNCHWYPLPIQV